MVSLLLVPTFQQEIHHAIIPYYDVMYFPFLKPDLIWMWSKLYLKKIPTTSFSCLHFFAASWSFCGPPIIDGLKFGQVCSQGISSQRSFLKVTFMGVSAYRQLSKKNVNLESPEWNYYFSQTQSYIMLIRHVVLVLYIFWNDQGCMVELYVVN